MTIYVAGGIYPHSETFLLVRPSGEDQLPYVSSHPHGSLQSSTRHHSHYYRLEGDELFLEKESWEAYEIGAPKRIKISKEMVEEIHKSFEEHDHK